MSGRDQPPAQAGARHDARPRRARDGRARRDRRAGHGGAHRDRHPGAGRQGAQLPRPPGQDPDRQRLHQGAHQDHRAAREIFDALAEGTIAVVAGFQGVDEHGNITTLGRGGSDTTAVAIAAAIGADACEIYTDVDGVYTTDPNICPSARKIDRISYEEMLELASLGAKVLQIRSVEVAMKYGVPVHVRSSFSDAPGTWVVGEEKSLERRRRRRRRLRQGRGPGACSSASTTSPASSPSIFGALADKNISRRHDHPERAERRESRDGRPRKTDVTFTVAKTDLARAKPLIDEIAEQRRRARASATTRTS